MSNGEEVDKSYFAKLMNVSSKELNKIEDNILYYNDKLYFDVGTDIYLYCTLPSLEGAEAYNYCLDYKFNMVININYT